jgi:hypothetical protein
MHATHACVPDIAPRTTVGEERAAEPSARLRGSWEDDSLLDPRRAESLELPVDSDVLPHARLPSPSSLPLVLGRAMGFASSYTHALRCHNYSALVTCSSTKRRGGFH